MDWMEVDYNPFLVLLFAIITIILLPIIIVGELIKDGD